VNGQANEQTNGENNGCSNMEVHMNYIKIQEIDEQLPVSSERAFPAAPFPCQYVHCVVDDLRYAVQAVYALRTAGYNARDIHVMASWDFVEAVERREQQQNRFTRVLTRILSFIDEDFANMYLSTALRGKHVLMVRLSASEQMEQVRDVLAAHHAHLIKYVDTWTVTTLRSAPEYSVW
jgi:hypothetical protein